MPQANRSIELLETCIKALEMAEEPMHYKTLTRFVIESGLWAEPWGKEPDQILYSAIHNDVKRNGDQSRFVFMGEGVFCAATLEGAQDIEAPKIRDNANRDPLRRPGDAPIDTEMRRKAYQENSRCGNCASLQWTGPQIMLREIGGCSQYERSRRTHVYECSEPCPYWAPRTMAQRERDRLDRMDDVMAAMKVNIQLKGNRR